MPTLLDRFLYFSYNKEAEEIQERRNKQQDIFHNCIKSKKMKIEESENDFAQLKNEFEEHNFNLLKEIELNKNKIINLKNKYYDIIKNIENCDKRIKFDNKKLILKRDELFLILKQKNEQYKIILKEKDDRILHFETQNFKLTLLENQN